MLPELGAMIIDFAVLGLLRSLHVPTESAPRIPWTSLPATPGAPVMPTLPGRLPRLDKALPPPFGELGLGSPMHCSVQLLVVEFQR
jgi:hypothetical protein